MPLIQTLPQGKLDIIGDIHGQYEALQNLLHYLGYDPNGKHPQGRKIVLVGDLVDRGENSPAVLAWFQQAHQLGYAYMVLGNHEINLLMNEPKDGSGWFFNSRAEKDAHNYAPWERLPENQKRHLIDFLKTQPLVLQRSDLRIVHAAWLPESIAKLAEHNHEDIVNLHQEWEEHHHCCTKHAPWFDAYLQEQRQHAHDLENPSKTPPMLHYTAIHDVYKSTINPIRALTCGIETVAVEPFYASGRWRFSVRYPWWDDYQDGDNGTTRASRQNIVKIRLLCRHIIGMERVTMCFVVIFLLGRVGGIAKKRLHRVNPNTVWQHLDFLKKHWCLTMAKLCKRNLVKNLYS